MARTAEHGEDFVVDMVVEIDPRGADLDELTSRIVLPGAEVLRICARGTIWLTAVVTARTECDAVRQVQEAVVAQTRGVPGVTGALVTSIGVADLYGRLDGQLTDEEVARIDLRDLVADHLWDRPGARRSVLVARDRLSSTA